jgi:hypothetical protein
VAHSGYSDYWGGLGGRGQGKGCAFAYYGPETSLRDIVDQWVEETWTNDHDFEDLPESVTQDEVRDCIVSALTQQGRDDYEAGELCEWSLDWRDANDWSPGDDDDDCMESPVVILVLEWEDHPDYKPDSDWSLCHRDDGQWEWAHKYGHDVGPYPDEAAAWADCPDCPILRELRGG